MGHVRLGSLPDTPRWRRVVDLLAEGDVDVGPIADATIHAAETGLERASVDEGLRHSLWLLTQLTIAARAQDFALALRARGIEAPSKPSLFELVAAYADAVDRHLQRAGTRTDIGEMAQLSATETIAALCGERAATLFGTTPDDVKRAAYEFSTPKGFSTLTHEFFARFTQRYLIYHLSRELSQHVGAERTFRSPQEHSAFIEQLRTHCQQVTLIVRDFAGEWYSKARFKTGIRPEDARGFLFKALDKIRSELAVRRGRDVE